MRTNFHARLPRNEQNEWLYARVMAKGREINEEFWRFAIDGIDEIQVLRYRPMQRIDWHFDTAAGYHRKIACVVTLSPPESHWRGELEIVGRHDNKSEAPLQGAATWFPTYLRHRATRPWWGERWSFVAWLTGPDWV